MAHADLICLQNKMPRELASMPDPRTNSWILKLANNHRFSNLSFPAQSSSRLMKEQDDEDFLDFNTTKIDF